MEGSTGKVLLLKYDSLSSGELLFIWNINFKSGTSTCNPGLIHVQRYIKSLVLPFLTEDDDRGNQVNHNNCYKFSIIVFF